MTIHLMSTSEWTILQNQGTTPTIPQLTIMHYRYLHQGQGRNWTLMLSTDKKYMQYYHSNTNNLKPVDINFNNLVGLWRNYSNLPWSST